MYAIVVYQIALYDITINAYFNIHIESYHSILQIYNIKIN